jgi:FKBP-type peptidyl-prolyl cis-trans isomerase FkpA
MKKLLLFMFIAVSLFMMQACNNTGFKKTKSGLLYKIIANGQGPTAKKGQFLKLDFMQKIRDSIMYNSADAIPVYPPVDSTTPNYSATEIFPLLRSGDSAVIVLLADSIQHKSRQPLPPFIKKKDKIFILFHVRSILADQAAVLQDREQEMAKMKVKEIKTVEDYLAANKINATKTPKGSYVEVKSTGDGQAVDSGKEVSVYYTGRAIPSGKVFETNTTGADPKPIKFVVGRRQIIPGWDDGLRAFKKGGKGTLYLPAFMAYDAQPGPGNKPFENLIFDVEVVDVTDAPKPVVQARPGMSQIPAQKNAPAAKSAVPHK